MNARLAPSPRRSAPRRRRGQNLTEYALITFLVAVGTIGVVGLFGDNLRHLFGSSAESLAGGTQVQNGGTAPSPELTRWSTKGSALQGGTEGNPGGTEGNPGGTTNKGGQPGGPGGGNPGGTTNAEARGDF
jgi:Flp pilus assembly pilin Flp